MNAYLTWLLKDVLPHIAAQERGTHAVLVVARERARDFEAVHRSHAERHQQLQAAQDELERLARALGATDSDITAATAPRLCEGATNATH